MACLIPKNTLSTIDFMLSIFMISIIIDFKYLSSIFITYWSNFISIGCFKNMQIPKERERDCYSLSSSLHDNGAGEEGRREERGGLRRATVNANRRLRQFNN